LVCGGFDEDLNVTAPELVLAANPAFTFSVLHCCFAEGMEALVYKRETEANTVG